MARRCELTGKGVLVGNLVSHSNHKTKCRFLPNLLEVSLFSDALKKRLRFRIAANTLRSIEKRGGIDQFLLSAKGTTLSTHARKLQAELQKATGNLSAEG